MRSSSIIAIMGAAFTGLVASMPAAVAGDLAPPPLPVAPPLDVPCCGSEAGWYLRGDIGTGYSSVGKHSIKATPALNDTTLRGSGDDLGGLVHVDVGVGYQVNSWLRFDVTGEYRTGGHLSSVDDYAYRPKGGTPQDGTDFYRANVSSAVGLVNGYVDLGTWYCLTPYLGGGVGVAYNRVSGFTDQGINVINPGQNNAFASPSGTTFREGNKTNFAWALMAGVGYEVTRNLKLDIGYRYLNLGDATTGSSVDRFGNTQSFKYLQKDLASHDIRIGMRWQFADSVAHAPTSYSQPIIRKY